MKVQLTSKDLPATRQLLLKKQGNICQLCKQPAEGRMVADHNHYTGLIRGIIHAQCNWMLGKIERAALRSGRNNFVQLAAGYIQNQPTDYLYPVKSKRKRRKKK